tara:strand:- start:599 stop:1873 length:1275 start_codon:yes stop_codon:yes gene_type:complete
MRTIESANSDSRWILAPIREEFSQHTSQIELARELKGQYSYYNIATNDSDGRFDVSMAVESGFDFAKKYQKEFGEAGSLYIEQRPDNTTGIEEYIMVLIQGGRIEIDRILTKSQLLEEIDSMSESIEFSSSESNIDDRPIIREYNAIFPELEEKLKYIAGGQFTSLPSPLTELLMPTMDVELLEERLALKNIKSTKNTKSNLMKLLIVFGMVFIYMMWPQEQVIITEYKDDFKVYRTMMTQSLPSASNRLAQAYNIQSQLSNIPGWNMYKVTHSKQQDVQVQMEKAAGGSMRQLQIIAEKHKFILMQSKEGVILATNGANTPVFRKEDLVLFKINEVFQIVRDSMSVMTPTNQLRMIDYRNLDTASNKWRTLRASIELVQVKKQDLLMLKSIFNGLPITFEMGNYQINNETLSGSFIIQIHGVD